MIDDSLVSDWHLAFGVPVASMPTYLTPERKKLREELILEEWIELRQAVGLTDIADALGDLLYVVIGAALEYGLPLPEIFAEIHRSNMTKLGADGKPVLREDGKVLKGPRYDAPCLAAIVYHDWRPE